MEKQSQNRCKNRVNCMEEKIGMQGKRGDEESSINLRCWQNTFQLLVRITYSCSTDYFSTDYCSTFSLVQIPVAQITLVQITGVQIPVVQITVAQFL